MIHRLTHAVIKGVRHLRQITAFKISTRVLVVFLMLAGTWVTTRNMNVPEALSLSDKAVHMIVFFGFAVLMDLATSRQPFWLWKGLPLLFYGASIEVLQYFSPDRSFSVFDWLADLSGIALYYIVKLALIWLDAKWNSNSKY